MSKIMRTFGRAISREGSPGDPIEFDLSTPGRKRDGIKLDLTRMRVDNFDNNPVALWMHGRDVQGGVPIGRWNAVQFRGDGEDTSLIGELVFDQADDFARKIEGKFRDGFLNAVSISWGTSRSETGEIEFDLLEAGPVPIPADPEALMRADESSISAYRDALHKLTDAVDAAVEEEARDGVDVGDLTITIRAEGSEPRDALAVHVTRVGGPLSYDDLWQRLQNAVRERYGLDSGGWYYAATVFAVFDSDVVVRVYETADYVRHSYTVDSAGDVDLGEGARVFLSFEDAPESDDERAVEPPEGAGEGEAPEFASRLAEAIRSRLGE